MMTTNLKAVLSRLEIVGADLAFETGQLVAACRSLADTANAFSIEVQLALAGEVQDDEGVFLVDRLAVACAIDEASTELALISRVAVNVALME